MDAIKKKLILKYFALSEGVKHAWEIWKRQECQVDRPGLKSINVCIMTNLFLNGGIQSPWSGWARYGDPGDKAQSALGTDEKMLQVVTSVVLLHAGRREKVKKKARSCMIVKELLWKPGKAVNHLS